MTKRVDVCLTIERQREEFSKLQLSVAASVPVARAAQWRIQITRFMRHSAAGRIDMTSLDNLTLKRITCNDDLGSLYKLVGSGQRFLAVPYLFRDHLLIPRYYR
jgi:hypothetical protein